MYDCDKPNGKWVSTRGTAKSPNMDQIPIFEIVKMFRVFGGANPPGGTRAPRGSFAGRMCTLEFPYLVQNLKF